MVTSQNGKRTYYPNRGSANWQSIPEIVNGEISAGPLYDLTERNISNGQS